MKDFLVLGKDVVELASGDVDAPFVELFEEEGLGDVTVVILVEDVALQKGSEMIARHDVAGQGRQQSSAIGGFNAFAEVACDDGLEEQFLDEEFLEALGGRPRWWVREGDLDFDGVDESKVLVAFGGARTLVARSGRWLWWRSFQTTGGNLGAGLLAFEDGDLVSRNFATTSSTCWMCCCC